MSAVTGAVLVTGASGHVGREAVRALVARGLPVRAALRDPSRPPAALVGAMPVAFDFLAPTTFAGALAGVDRVLLVRPPHLARPEHEIRPFLEAARAAGVRHVAFLSVQGVNPLVPHWRIERDLERSGMAFTHLRAGFFMQNLEAMHAEGIRRRDAIEIPAGGGRTSFVDVRDLGDAAAVVLAEPGHRNRAYTLTGSEALGYDEVGRLLGEALGRTIRYLRLSRAEFAVRMRADGHPPDLVAVVGRIYFVVRLHLAGRVTPDLAALLGRPPRTMREYVRDAAPAFARPAAADSDSADERSSP